MAEDGSVITANLLLLLESGVSTQVHDTNIVATMQSMGVRRLLTNNPDDFVPYRTIIEVIPLLTVLH